MFQGFEDARERELTLIVCLNEPPDLIGVGALHPPRTQIQEILCVCVCVGE